MPFETAGLYCEYFAVEVIGLFVHLCAIKKICYSEKNNYSPKHGKIEASGTLNAGKKTKKNKRTKGTPTVFFANYEWAESHIYILYATLPHTRMSWTKEILTRKYEPEHAKL